jgi:hypothetical protein
MMSGSAADSELAGQLLGEGECHLPTVPHLSAVGAAGHAEEVL